MNTYVRIHILNMKICIHMLYTHIESVYIYTYIIYIYINVYTHTDKAHITYQNTYMNINTLCTIYIMISRMTFSTKNATKNGKCHNKTIFIGLFCKRDLYLIDPTNCKNATAHKSTKARNSDSSVSRNIYSN